MFLPFKKKYLISFCNICIVFYCLSSGQLNEVIRFVVPLLREKAKLRLSQIGKSTPFMSQSSHESLHKKLDNFSSEKLSKYS